MTRIHRPESLEETTALLSELDDAIVYGGGTAIQILQKQGLLFAEDLIDIAGLPGVRDVRFGPAEVTVGPMVSLRRMERDADLQRLVPLVAATCAKVANPRVRNTASVAGNIAHGDYRLDPPTALVVLGATVHLTSGTAERHVPIREFFTDFQQTAVDHDELITGISIPNQPTGSIGTYRKLSSLAENDWPTASAAVLVVPDGDVVEVRLGLGALAPTTLFLVFDVTSDMDEQQAVDAAIDIANSAMDPLPDIRGSAAYKAHLGRVAIEEAIRSTFKELPRD